MSGAAALNSAVTTYFAPAIRVRKLGAFSAGTQSGTLLPNDVHGDILQAQVTRACSGATQYTITLNNWYTATAQDRANRSASSEAVSRELSSLSQPLYPRYKYNDFGLIAFGDRLQIDMRYWPDPTVGQTLPLSAAQSQAWTPMACGPVTDMHFEFSSGSGARLTITGEDDLSQLKDRNGSRKDFPKAPERQIVREVLKLAKYPLTDMAASQVAWPAFADDNGQGISESILDGQSYLEFLQKLADRMDFELFIEFSDLTIPNSPMEFHFEPSRSRQPPSKSKGDLFVLRRDLNLIEFSPSIKVIDQPLASTVKGRDRDRSNPTKIIGNASPNALMDELYPDDTARTPKPLTPGPLVRQHFFPNRNDNQESSPNQSNLDQARADNQADAQLRKKAREFFTIEGTTIGLPRLRPGSYVQITGMRAPFDGFYYVSKTVHTYGSDGLRTKFSARRPGMPLPPYGEK